MIWWGSPEYIIPVPDENRPTATSPQIPHIIWMETTLSGSSISNLFKSKRELMNTRDDTAPIKQLSAKLTQLHAPLIPTIPAIWQFMTIDGSNADSSSLTKKFKIGLMIKEKHTEHEPESIVAIAAVAGPFRFYCLRRVIEDPACVKIHPIVNTIPPIILKVTKL